MSSDNLIVAITAQAQPLSSQTRYHISAPDVRPGTVEHLNLGVADILCTLGPNKCPD